MGQARRRKLTGTYPADRKLTFQAVGFGGLCSECDEIHEPNPNPFIYTVGLTDDDLPELLMIDPGADRRAVEPLHDLLTNLAKLQRRRGKAFEDGEHVHAPQIGMRGCVVLAAVERYSEEFSLLLAAIQRYGHRYRVLRVYGLQPRLHS